MRNTDLHDGGYEHYFKTCSLLKITVFRVVPSFSLVSKNRRSNGRMKTEAAVASETPVPIYWATWLYTPQETLHIPLAALLSVKKLHIPIASLVVLYA